MKLMKNSAYNLTLIAVIFLFLIFSVTGLISIFGKNTAYAQENQEILVDGYDFSDNSVLVTMDKDVGGVNKIHDKSYFKNIAVTAVTDLTYRENTSNVDFNRFKQILKLELKYHDKNYVLQAVEKIGKLKGVEAVTPNYYGEFCATANDALYDSQWGLKEEDGGIDIEHAWDITTGSKAIRVGVIDTGIAQNPDLIDNLATGWNFDDNNTDTNDTDGHGTHVAGIMGAKGDNDIGVSGVCKNIEIVPLKISNIFNSWPTGNVISAITYADNLWGTADQIDLLNFSGGGFPYNTNLYNAINNFRGLFVISSGNDGKDIDSKPDYPASFTCDNIIVVGALNSNGERSDFSNYGETTVDIYAPGSKILSTYPTELCTGVIRRTDVGLKLACETIWSSRYNQWMWDGTTHYDDGYHAISGTSMATPFVTGVAALLLSKNPNLTTAELKKGILDNADLIDISIPTSSEPPKVKKLNAYEAVKFDKVILDKNGGTGGDDYVYVKYGEDMPAATAPTRAGYRFKGYFKDNVIYYDANMKSVRQWDKTQATTLIAGWDKEYTITFKIDGDTTGEYTFVKDKVCYGDKWPPITMPPARTGYFVGQYIDVASGKTYYDRYGLPRYDTFTFTKDITLVGSWVANTYNVVVSYIQWYSDTATRISAYTARYYENLTFTADESMTVNNETRLFSFWSVIRGGQAYYDYNTNPWHEISYERSFSVNLAELVQKYYPDLKENEVLEFRATFNEEEKKCVAEGTLITLANGEQVPVEQLTGDETLLVWNLFTGTFDTAPILFIDSDPLGVYEVINLYFSDGTTVKVISEHGFWDLNLNEYVYLGNDASQYIGHWFNKQTTNKNNELSWTAVQLTDVVIREEYTTAWSPVTYGHLCYYVNGMLSMPGGIEGLFNIFEVDSETLKYNEAAYLLDIETYGLYTYEEFSEVLPVSKELFEAVNGQYLKIAIGKGLIDLDTIASYISKYSVFFD